MNYICTPADKKNFFMYMFYRSVHIVQWQLRYIHVHVGNSEKEVSL